MTRAPSRPGPTPPPAPGPGTLLAGAGRALIRGGPLHPRRLLLLLLLLPAFLLLQAAHWVGLALDELLFPGYRRVEIREPLFVVGLPRSGTTALHRVLSLDRERFTTLRLWQLLFAPSITQRRLVAGLGRVDRWVGGPGRRLLGWLEGRATGWFADVHPVTLGDAEEDYLLLLPVWAAFILVLAAPDDRRVWALTALDRDDPRRADRLLAFYRRCVQRHLYVEGGDRRLLSKNPGFSGLVKALDRAFPDARFIACFRDPERVVPSQLSSLETAARIMGWEVAEPRYRDRFLAMLRYYGEHLAEELPLLPGERYALTVLSRMAPDMSGTVHRIYGRFGWSPGPAFARALERESRRARGHRSGHRYRLEDYGLADDDLAPLRRVVARVRARVERDGP